MVGHFYKDQDLYDKRDDMTSFMISKRTLAKLSLDNDESFYEFYVEIRNGKVLD